MEVLERREPGLVVFVLGVLEGGGLVVAGPGLCHVPIKPDFPGLRRDKG